MLLHVLLRSGAPLPLLVSRKNGDYSIKMVPVHWCNAWYCEDRFFHERLARVAL